MKADDATLSEHDKKVIRRHADLLLRKAGAYGTFPTPIDDIVVAAELEVEKQLSFDEEGLGELYSVLPTDMKLDATVLKRALGKVEGVLHREDRRIFIDPSLHKSRQKFITLHEVGHHDIPWQRHTYRILEDSRSELDEGTRDQFEREANCFASDVWFQLDTFTSDARDCEFGIGAPIKLLTKRYGTSCYATLRRYLDHCARVAALVVCEALPKGATCLTVRRVLESPEFRQQFGSLALPHELGAESFFFRNVPANKFRSPTPWMMDFHDGRHVPCLVEAYNSTKQIFFLVYPIGDGHVSLAA